MSWSLFGKATFSDWISTDPFAGTGERGGFEKSELLGDSSEDVPCAGVEEWAEIELSSSAARLGEMQGVLIPAVKVRTDAEFKNFCDMWHAHLVPGGRSLLDFPASSLSGTPTCSR